VKHREGRDTSAESRESRKGSQRGVPLTVWHLGQRSIGINGRTGGRALQLQKTEYRNGGKTDCFSRASSSNLYTCLVTFSTSDNVPYPYVIRNCSYDRITSPYVIRNCSHDGKLYPKIQCGRFRCIPGKNFEFVRRVFCNRNRNFFHLADSYQV
jgi:hypothetical protein